MSHSCAGNDSSVAGPERPCTQTHPFDAPGASTVSSPLCAPDCGTIALANNAEGAVVGYYTDANIVNHGFVRAPNGYVFPFDPPGAGLETNLDQGTFPYSINDWGLIAGFFRDSGNAFHSFLRYPDGSFSTYGFSGAGTAALQGTEALDVNLEGATAGFYIDGTGVEHGFVRSSLGVISSIDPDSSMGTTVCEETCLNAAGTTTGSFLDSKSVYHGFVRDRDGKITKFNAPGAGTGAYQGTFAASINDEGMTRDTWRTQATCFLASCSHLMGTSPAFIFRQRAPAPGKVPLLSLSICPVQSREC
jgi:hypothetical protein